MKTQLKLTALSLAFATFNGSLTMAFAQGSLTPPGAPASTMKSLDQIEARTPIASAPYDIQNPGSYYLTADLLVEDGSDAITVTISGVTLDLNGFTIRSTSSPVGGSGIYLKDALRHITILNGNIAGSVTNNGSGIFDGSGFGSGITIANDPPLNLRVVGVSVSGCLYEGINLGESGSSVVESCTVHTVGNYGIVASTITDCIALDCGGTAIHGDRVSNCTGESFAGVGVQAVNAQNCSGSSNSDYGIHAGTAQNCYGKSTTVTGLFAERSAQNCYGYSVSHIGLHAVTALNCNGESQTSAGITAAIAQNCYGVSGTGIGVNAINVAQNCLGVSHSAGTGLYSSKLAISSVGISTSGTGLSAMIANACVGNSYFGIPTSIDHQYNMP